MTISANLREPDLLPETLNKKVIKRFSNRATSMQEILIFLIFAVALGYLGNRTYQSFSKKKAGCGKGCGCATDTKTRAVVTAK